MTDNSSDRDPLKRIEEIMNQGYGVDKSQTRTATRWSHPVMDPSPHDVLTVDFSIEGTSHFNGRKD